MLAAVVQWDIARQIINMNFDVTANIDHIAMSAITVHFFPSHTFLRQRRKKALIRVRNRRDFENSVL